MQNENVRIYINSLESLLHTTHKRETQSPPEPLDLKWDHTTPLCYPLLASCEHFDAYEECEQWLNPFKQECFFKAFQRNISKA